MTRLAGPLSVIGVVLFAVFFASRNGAERVTLDLGFVILYGVPITMVAFGGLLIGMLVMLGAGIQSDLKVRAILRQRLAEQTQEDGEYVDTAQRDLFLHSPPQEGRPLHRIPEESRAAAPPPVAGGPLEGPAETPLEGLSDRPQELPPEPRSDAEGETRPDGSATGRHRGESMD